MRCARYNEDMKRLYYRVPLAVLLLIGVTGLSYFGTPPKKAEALTQIYSLSLNTTFYSVPSDWNDVDNSIEIIARGGDGATGSAGNGSTGGAGGGGGGGGAYVKVTNIALTPGQNITLAIDKALGGETGLYTVVATSSNCWSGGVRANCIAAAQQGADASGLSGGAGGAAASSYPTNAAARFSGGDGGDGGTSSATGGNGGGGGGGAAGPNGDGEAGDNGANSVSSTGGTGGTGGDGDAGFGGAGVPFPSNAGGAGTEYEGTDGAGAGGSGATGGSSGNFASFAGGEPGDYGAGGGGGGGGGRNGSGSAGASTSDDAVLIVITYTPDTFGPEPDPMEFATPPFATFSVNGITGEVFPSVKMIATVAVDDESGAAVTYLVSYVPCDVDVGSGGTSQTVPNFTAAFSGYTDSVDDFNKCYGYQVAAKDTLGNWSASSTRAVAYSIADVPGTPTLTNAGVSSLDLEHDADLNPTSGPTTLFAVKITTSDSNWNDMYVDADGNPSATEVWLSDAALDALTLDGLEEGTVYSAQSKARNQDSIETSFSSSGSGTTLLSVAPRKVRLPGGVRLQGGVRLR